MLLNCCISFSQDGGIDSLLTLLKKDKEDTNKVNHYNELARQLQNASIDSAATFLNEGLSLAEKLQWKTGMANSLGMLGSYYHGKSDFEKALDHYQKALKISEQLNNKDDIAKYLNLIGNICSFQGDYPKALDYMFKALKLNEELKNKDEVAGNLANVAIVYWNQGDNTKSLDYHFRSLKIHEELNNLNGVALQLNNIGAVYWNMKDYPKAIECYLKGLGVREKQGDNFQVASLQNNIGAAYFMQGDYSNSLSYYEKSLKTFELMGKKEGISAATGNIGNVYIRKKEYKNAYNYLYKALALSTEMKAMNDLTTHYKKLSTLYEKSDIPLPDSVGGKVLNIEQMRIRSKYYYMRFIAIKDVIFSEESKKELVRKEMNFEFEKKEAITKAEHEKQVEVAAAENRRKQIFIWLVASVALAIGIIAVIILRSLRITKKQKGEIEKQKTEIELQKEEIEISHKKVNDSINYAQKIQYSILPSDDEIKKFIPDYFLFFQPKDVISGDFYWFCHFNGFSYVAVADCTGHGVPGALMSMTVHSLLNEVMLEEKLTDPGEILSRLHASVFKTLQQHKGDEYSQDGCDISLCVIDHKNKLLHFSGARNHGYLTNGKTITVLKATAKSIGGLSMLGEPEPERKFKSETIELKEDLLLVLSTDGVFDQLNKQDEAFGNTRFKNLITEAFNQPISDGTLKFSSAINDWKKDVHQQDDMLVMGLKLNLF